ncbi:DHA2 family efflux MFS transporter permease subunit [Paenibacillus sp. GSMTC-2017]|uniref:DHA2 family efflux MFS transporter permease subunit n=1 Tax=Paenibacillus sp. GSMTC-2017 TaxID=2794350 RepID=UPI0018D87EE2|nr:DHA2 family efflux MFS transporter permease subunit [Paenibacillus sp. GSMTC-2017]MBH5318820.1 DHA2 family efflux MFS transporter permease subunit [Paenibacillus sp. GSMTC-2017]
MEQTKPVYGGLKQVFAVSLGLFIVFIDSTIVNIALPNMIEEYSIGLGAASWIINSFVITLAVLLVTMGKLADIFGKARFFLIGLFLFMISSFLCGAAPNEESLIIFRVLQGISGAMVIPTSMVLVRSAVPPERAGLAMGIWGAVGALAVAIGPSLGGLITELINWRWVFYINVPVILIGLPLTWLVFRGTKEERKPFRIDLWGTISLSSTLFFLTYSILQGQEFGWLSGKIIASFALSLISGLAFIFIERKVKDPLLDFTILQNRAYVAGIASNLLSGIVLMGTMILLPIFLAEVKGFDTLDAAFAITPLSAVMLIVAPLVGRLIDKVGYVWPLIIGYMIIIAGFGLLSTVHADMSVVRLVWYIAVAGAGIGIIMVTSVTVSTSVVRPDQISLASGIFAMMRNLGGAIGVALFISITLTGLNSQSSVIVDEGIAKFKQADLPPVVQEQAIARLEERREHFFDFNKPAPEFQLSSEQKEELIEQKKKEAIAALPAGTEITAKLQEEIGLKIESELKVVEEKVTAIRESITEQGKSDVAESMGKAFLSGLILCVLFSFTIVFLRRKAIEGLLNSHPDRKSSASHFH